MPSTRRSDFEALLANFRSIFDISFDGASLCNLNFRKASGEVGPQYFHWLATALKIRVNNGFGFRSGAKLQPSFSHSCLSALRTFGMLAIMTVKGGFNGHKSRNDAASGGSRPQQR